MTGKGKKGRKGGGGRARDMEMGGEGERVKDMKIGRGRRRVE